MYSGSGYSEFEIGDVTVLMHKGIYHLFHLIIPNHDYIAHAVSRDGISWKRTKNAMFVGNPGEWDDDMLWTMDVCEDGDAFTMYYTGLQRKDRGKISRIGFAQSNNLLDWKKISKPALFIEPQGTYYEDAKNNPRHWLSFRDPYRFDYNGETYLLVCARVSEGPLSRRGCVGVIKITEISAEFLPPLVYPMAFDDIECPCAFQLNGKYYVLGSIREDIKVRYWFAQEFFGEYHAFHYNVALPNGNYAARVVEDGEHLLVFNFFYTQGRVDLLRVLPPPKQLDTDEKGRLLLKSFYKWELMVTDTIVQKDMPELKLFFKNKTASCEHDDGKWICGSRSGYEVFYFDRPSSSFIWEGQINVEGMGKLGLVSDVDNDGSGYYFSFDVNNGVVRIRAWGYNPANDRQDFIFNDIQTNVFSVKQTSFKFRLIRYGNYIELAIDDVVKLTLMDYTYSESKMGLYSSSSVISLEQSVFKILPDPEEEYADPTEIQKLL
ncbi:MAG: glycosyl hydrolase family 32 [Bacteroidetes bacterium]|nr:glycosyl hydrolase family 32 [Bacteroidota bacterium]